jgi:hypothetical protein
MYFFHAQRFFAYFFYADCSVIPRLPRPFRPFKLVLFHDKNRSHTSENSIVFPKKVGNEFQASLYDYIIVTSTVIVELT